MTTLINQTLLQLKADYSPTITIRIPISMCTDSFSLGDYSILKWDPNYYRGFFEVFHQSWDEPFFTSTLLEVFQHLASLDPSLFYSPTLSPERFL